MQPVWALELKMIRKEQCDEEKKVHLRIGRELTRKLETKKLQKWSVMQRKGQSCLESSLQLPDPDSNTLRQAQSSAARERDGRLGWRHYSNFTVIKLQKQGGILIRHRRLPYTRLESESQCSGHRTEGLVTGGAILGRH